MSWQIPTDLTEEVLKPMPGDAVYELGCKRVSVLNRDNIEITDPADGKDAKFIRLSIQFLTTDPQYDECRKEFLHRITLPTADDDPQTKDLHLRFAKRDCEAWGVSYSAKGFNPFDFEGKAAKALIVQTPSRDDPERIFTNIRSYAA